MEKRILISMVDYVLDETVHLPKECREPALEKIGNYAKFLSIPLTIGMFVPCDEYDQPMTEYLQYDDKLCDFCPLDKKGVYSVPGGIVAGCEGSRCDVAGENYQDAYKEALDNVIFEGFIPCVINGVQSVSCSLKSVHYNLLEENTIEYIADGTLTLTQSAIIKYQI